MKIGIIGAGNIAAHHVKGYISNGAEIAGYRRCERGHARAQKKRLECKSRLHRLQ